MEKEDHNSVLLRVSHGGNWFLLMHNIGQTLKEHIF